MSDTLLVATRKGLFHVERIGGGWEVVRGGFLGDNLPLVLHDPRDGSLYAALDHGHFGGKMHRSADGGETWDEIGVPTYPELPKGAKPDIDPMSGQPIPSSLNLIWALATGGNDEPRALWAGTIPGGLFRSDDGGQAWELVRGLWDQPKRLEWFGGGMDWAGIHSICVDPGDSKRVTVGVSCGGVWVTGDGGRTWDCRADGMWASYMPPERKHEPFIQDPHCVVQCRARPECFWAQHHNGVFRTTDGCASWQEVKDIPPSTFGFAVAVHPDDPDTAWLVPGISDEKRIPVDGRVVVARTRDGGKTFDALRDGLPQRFAYDLTLRHALDIDRTGNRLAFGSTTGSLWVTENQGDSWQCISNHLPPVYCVRFVN